MQKYQFTPNIKPSVFHCSPGFIPHTLNACMCLENVAGIVKCAGIGGSQTAFIQNGFCMTYRNTTDSIAVGLCLYSCIWAKLSLFDDKTSFHFLPDNVSLLQEATCNQLNRHAIIEV